MKSEANKLLVSTVQKLMHRDAFAQIEKILARTHPADLAYVFNFLTRPERRALFERIQNPLAAEMLTEVEPRVLSDFLSDIEDHRLVQLLEQMSSDDTADVLSLIEDEARLDILLPLMQRDELVTTQSLLEFDPESAGGLMVPDFFALQENTSAHEALRRLQEDAGRTEVVFYLYVINAHGHLVGVTSLRQLVLAPPDMLLADFMISEVIRVSVDTDQEEVARLIARYNLVALPVVDANNQLVGVVTVDDIIDVIRLEATEDMMLMAGAGDQQVDRLHVNPLAAARARAPWLLPSFIGGVAALLLLWGVRDDVTSLPLIAAIFPVVMMLSGNVGTQSAAIVTRGLALRRTDFVGLGKVVLAETAAGALLGLLWGSLLGVGSYLVFGEVFGTDPIRLALLSGGAMVTSMTLAAALGGLLPMAFSRFGLDPATATGPFVTTLVDVMAVMICIMFLGQVG